MRIRRPDSSAERKRTATATETAPEPVATSHATTGAPSRPSRLAISRHGRLGEELRLGTRDEGAPVGPDAQRVPLLEAADVRDRLARRAACQGRVERTGDIGADLRLRVGEHPGSVAGRDVGQEHLRVQAGGRRGGIAETARGLRQGGADGSNLGHPISRHAASSVPRSSRRFCWSASRRGSTSLSRSPSSRPGRL